MCYVYKFIGFLENHWIFGY